MYTRFKNWWTKPRRGVLYRLVAGLSSITAVLGEVLEQKAASYASLAIAILTTVVAAFNTPTSDDGE